VTLSETEFKITPANPSVSSTGKITITMHNTGTITHSLAVQTPAGVVRARDIPPGGSATLVVNAAKAGHYTFYCPIDGHRASGMQGVLAVGSAGGGGGGGGGAAATTSSSSSGGGAYSY
jgi:plastocyanin